MNNKPLIRAYGWAVIAWIFSVIFALKNGSITDASWELVFQLRFPRVVLGSAVGMGLAVSGAVLQAFFANPLAEPYTLGISSGSALGAVIGIAFGAEWMFWSIPLPAFLGALVFAIALQVVSLRPGSTNATLLLAGVMFSFFGSSLIALWMALSEPSGVQSAVLWLTGDLSRARPRDAFVAGGAVISAVIALWARAQDLDGLLMGEEGAASLGVSVHQVRKRLIVLLSIVIAFCVSFSGMIGFVGLIVPHFARKFVGSLHRHLIPLCAIWGAAILVFSDTLARILIRPYELPVGVITALLGAPIFLMILLSRARSRGLAR